MMMMMMIGNKFTDEDFLNEIKNDAIVSLVETHMHSEISAKKRPINLKSHKGSGGIALFVRDSFSHYVVPVKNENDDSVWMKIKKEITGEKADIYIGSVYLSPYKSKDENVKKISNLFEEILDFKGNGRLLSKEILTHGQT